MTPKTYQQLAAEAAERITEILPWDVPDFLTKNPNTLFVDIRERSEFGHTRIPGTINIPRGILESAADWDYAETEPALVTARDKPVLLICRSGSRSALAAEVLVQMGFADPRSVKLGIKGWNDADQELINADGATIGGDDAADRIEQSPRPDQRNPLR